MERCNRTIREAMEEHAIEYRFGAEEILEAIINHYNTERLHIALGYQTPATWCRGDPVQLTESRRLKLTQPRHRRKQINLGIRQRILPLEPHKSAN